MSASDSAVASGAPKVEIVNDVKYPNGSIMGRRATAVKVEHSNTFTALHSIDAIISRVLHERGPLVSDCPGFAAELQQLQDVVNTLLSYEPTSQDVINAVHRHENGDAQEDAHELDGELRMIKLLGDLTGQVLLVRACVQRLDANPPEVQVGCCSCFSPPPEYDELLEVRGYREQITGVQRELHGIYETFKSKHWSKPFPALQHTLAANAAS